MHGRVARHRVCSVFVRRASPRCRQASTASAPRLRFAPSPTGLLHFGGLRTALYNHLLARKLGGTWLLRIEDTDQKRLVPGATEKLMETLTWAGLDYDEGPDRPGDCGPYKQSERRAIYQRYIQRLLDAGHAYRCFCGPERLEQMKQAQRSSDSPASYDRRCLHLSEGEVRTRLDAGEDHVVRFKSQEGTVTHEDLVYGRIDFHQAGVDDVVLVKSDGLPTYHFANVVDDHEMRITHVLRGEEWLTSIPKHLSLYQALGLRPPAFAHLPLMMNRDGSKLSKRTGHTNVEHYANPGYEPEAVVNFIAMQGMTHPRTGPPGDRPPRDRGGDDTDVFSMAELIHHFSIDAITKTRTKVDMQKLTFLNSRHLNRKLSSPTTRSDVVNRATEAVRRKLGVETDGEYVGKVLDVLGERVALVTELPDVGPYFFQDFAAPSLPPSADFALRHAVDRLSEVPSTEWTPEGIKTALYGGQDDPRLNSSALMKPLRMAVTGSKVGAGMFETMAVLGQQTTLRRLSSALDRLSTATSATSTTRSAAES